MFTVQLICIWFSVGAVFAAAACFLDAPPWLQLLVFLATSVAVLIVGRPLFIERLTPRRQPTNADRVIGQLGLVKEDINNLSQTGRVNANGLDWTARSAYGEVILAGATVLVLQIDGVKLIVQPMRPEPEPAEPELDNAPLESESESEPEDKDLYNAGR
jgi:membrane protein implicated in regulation of membrane protease activity